VQVDRDNDGAWKVRSVRLPYRPSRDPEAQAELMTALNKVCAERLESLPEGLWSWQETEE
jgi:hypothetical protein